jgi:hypothetical protein
MYKDVSCPDGAKLSFGYRWVTTTDGKVSRGLVLMSVSPVGNSQMTVDVSSAISLREVLDEFIRDSSPAKPHVAVSDR